MAFDIATIAQAGRTGAMDAQADKLLKRTQSSAGASSASSLEDAKITKAGKDFESILLGSWLQQAESTFAKAPGGDDQDDDGDSGGNQFQGIAMQALSGSLTAKGGIGIAKMITSHLHSAADKEAATGKQTGSSNATPSLLRKET